MRLGLNTASHDKANALREDTEVCMWLCEGLKPARIAPCVHLLTRTGNAVSSMQACTQILSNYYNFLPIFPFTPSNESRFL